MTFERKHKWAAIAAAVLFGLASAACGQIPLLPRVATDSTDLPADALSRPVATPVLVQAPDSNSIAGAPQATTPGRQTSPVRRGSIADTATFVGRVAGTDEVDLTYEGSGKVDSVPVKVGDNVHTGETLVQMQAPTITKDLNDARARLDTANLRLQQAQDQSASAAQAAQRTAAAHAIQDRQNRQAATTEAEANLRLAQQNMDRVSAGPSATDVRTAQANVASAQNAADKAQADLARLQRGADPSAVQSAQRILSSAQSDFDRAQAVVDRLTGGPDPNAVRAAQRDIERAETVVKIAQATKASDEASRAARDAMITNANLSLQDAQDRLAKLQQPPDSHDVAIAQRNLQVAKSAVDAAQSQLDVVRKGPDAATLDAAQAAVDNTQTLLSNAQDRLDELQSHPTPAELQDAQARLSAAQAALTRAKTAPPTDASTSDVSSSYDILILEKDVAQEQANVQTLEQELAATRVAAPFDGVVTALRVHAGDAVDTTKAVVSVARSAAPVLRIDLTDRDSARVSAGQSVSVKLDGASAASDGTVMGIADNPGGGKVAQVRVDWSSTPALGKTGQAIITVQQKDGVLLVPRKAVRSAGTQRYVQFQSSTSRKVANVQVGLMSADEAEILSGLTEGQLVFVGP